jgi:dTDP-L-rhamnose 4-epimerase
LAELALVTGGAGFIGSHTVDLLLERGDQVRVLDSLQPRVHPQGRPGYLSAEAELIVGDTADRNVLDRALEGVDVVYHLAAYQDYMTDFSTFIHTNTESSALLFELLVNGRHRVRKIVFASSQSVAGEGRYECSEHGVITPDARPIEQLERGDWELHCPNCDRVMEPRLIDEATVRPHTAYAVSKCAIELLARGLGSRYGIPTACMRYTYVHGPRNSFFNAYSGVLRRFALRVGHGLSPVCYEDGGQRRDYVNVRDVARANLLAMDADHAGPRVYNVGGGRPITVLEFAHIVLDAYGSKVEPEVPGSFRVGDTRHTVSDLEAISAIGWKPVVPAEESVREYVEWLSTYRDTRQYLDEAEKVLAESQIVRRVASAS